MSLCDACGLDDFLYHSSFVSGVPFRHVGDELESASSVTGLWTLTPPSAPRQVIMSVPVRGCILTTTQIRFRDSLPIRAGAGISASVIAFFLALEIAYLVWGLSPAAGPLGLWAFFLIIVGILFVVVGTGQTIVRRRENRRIQSRSDRA